MTSGSTSGVAAILVTTGRTPHLPTTLRAVAAQTLAPDCLVVVDVGPREGVAPPPRRATGPAGACPPAPTPTTATTAPLTAADLPTGAVLVRARGARTFGAAVRRAATDPACSGALAGAQRWWLLHDDSAPEPSCLEEQWSQADLGRTVAVVGPAQVSWDGGTLLEVGIGATRSGRRLESVVPGEIDQGQYDGRSDVLAVGTAGMLVDRAVWERLAGTDPALGPFGDGLEFGRRVRRTGYRVVVAPRARLRHARASLDPPGHPDARDGSFRARRTAQLYNWSAAVAWWQLPLVALWLLVWSPLRALGRLLTGSAHLAPDEVGAWGRLVALTPALAGARWRAHRQAVLPRGDLRALEARPGDVLAQRRLEARIRRSHARTPTAEPLVRDSLRRHSARSRATFAVVVGALLVVALTAWSGLLGGFGGAAWAGAPRSWGDLWAAAWSGWVPGGDGAVGPGDPVLVPLALLGAPFAALGVAPGQVWTWVAVLALPLAGASAWALACALTTSVPARAAAALTWAGLPALTVSATEGRLAAVLAHVVLPLVVLGWSGVCGSRAPLVVAGSRGAVRAPGPRPRAGGAGLAALALVVAVCSVPWLLGAAWVAVYVVAALVPATAGRSPQGRRGRPGRRGPSGPRGWTGSLPVRLLLTTVPAAVLVAPFVRRAAAHPGGWVALLTPGGPALASPAAASWQVVLGMPRSAPWSAPAWASGLMATVGAALLVAAVWALVAGILAPDVPVADAPEGSDDASSAPTRGRPRLLSCAVAVLVLGALAAAWGLQRVEVAAVPEVARAWPGPALSLAGLALVVLACRGTVSRLPWDAPTLRPVSAGAWVVAAAAAASLGGWAVAGPLGSAGTDPTGVHAVPARQVSAVSQEAQESGRRGRVLVLTRDASGTLRAQVLRGDGPLLTDASALTRLDRLQELRAGVANAASTSLARAVLTLAVAPDEDAVRVLAEHAVDTVAVPDPTSTTGAELTEALDRASSLERVGTTDAGLVWRVRPGQGLPARLTLQTTATASGTAASGTAAPTVARWASVDAGTIGARAELPRASSGILVLAERADPGWSASVDGVALRPVADPSGGWRQAFAVTGGGALRLSHGEWWTVPWRVASGAALVLAALAAVPARRRG